MDSGVCVVVTSIAAPTEAMRRLARGCEQTGARFIVIGDSTSPRDFQIDGCDFYDLSRQRATGLKLAMSCPTSSYARKNVGYLIAAGSGARVIVETDDDNVPRQEFWLPRERDRAAPSCEGAGWVNVYRYFTDASIWPRGFPLRQIRTEPPAFASLGVRGVVCPIQQGLVDGEPDVDAIYRLAGGGSHAFRNDRCVALSRGSVCPFNSQNTSWWPEAFPLLYLPATCSLRTADIWRSFVAQRIAHENGWSILFHAPTVEHVRNAHDLLADFEQEIPGYLHNATIYEALAALSLHPGAERIGDNLRACYEKLVAMQLLARAEPPLLEDWLEDMRLRQFQGS